MLGRNLFDNTLPALTSDQKTQLEICWLNGPALSGPGLIQGDMMRTAIDFQGKYPVELLRIFLPQATDFKGVIGFAETFDRWWMSHIIMRLQSSSCVYNTISGRSGFGVCCSGGSFDLQQCVKLAFPPAGTSTNPSTVLINSFDLSALIQLASGLLLGGDGIEYLNTRWVCKTPFGHVKPNMPFGLGKQSSPPVSWPEGVNNPYYSGLGKGKATSRVCGIDLR